MIPTFGYSFDRDTFNGNFPTRKAALDAALQALGNRSDVPEGIFVGQWIEVNPQTSDHSDMVLDAMRDRWQASSQSGEFLNHVNEHDAADLDQTINQCLREWLAKHNLVPTATKVRGVSEYPVPNVHHVDTPKHERETSFMGEA